jgi:DNA-nicking Smr family endonuclease
MTSRPGTDDDVELFRAAVGDAIPLRSPKRHRGPARPAAAIPVQSLLDEHIALGESRAAALDWERLSETADETCFLRAGVSRQVLRKLRRGHWVVQGELDLHGMTRPEAHAALAEFLRASVRHARRCVRIVHGKGLGSKNREPVLKGKVRGWLLRREEVLAFCEAPASQGGSGAVLVLLRS